MHLICTEWKSKVKSPLWNLAREHWESVSAGDSSCKWSPLYAICPFHLTSSHHPDTYTSSYWLLFSILFMFRCFSIYPRLPRVRLFSLPWPQSIIPGRLLSVLMFLCSSVSDNPSVLVSCPLWISLSLHVLINHVYNITWTLHIPDKFWHLYLATLFFLF